MIRVVGVHGVGNHHPGLAPAQAAARLSRIWQAAARRGLHHPRAELDLRVAYYAHHLTADTAQGPDDPAHLSVGEQQLLLDWARALGAPDEIAQGRLAAPARAAADWIARWFGLDHAVVRLLVSVFCREVHTYLTDPDRRHNARAELATVLGAREPTVVIAHSLGSVLAYETLHAHPEIGVELLLTLGSPLGMPDVIFPRLRPAPAPRGHRPPAATRWINIADPGDIIAIPRALTARFDGITADLPAPIHTFDTHKVRNYLACPATAGVLAAHLPN